MIQANENHAHNQWNADKHAIRITVQVQANTEIPIFQMKQRREYWWAEYNYSCCIWPWQHKRSSARLGFMVFPWWFFPFLFFHCPSFSTTAGCSVLLRSISGRAAQNKGRYQLRRQSRSCTTAEGSTLSLKAQWNECWLNRTSSPFKQMVTAVSNKPFCFTTHMTDNKHFV